MKPYILAGALMFLPSLCSASVLFSEIAWMGSVSNANDEWIELYNHGSDSVAVDGWTLTDGVSLDIPLTGTIPPRTIVLLERTDDATVPGVPAFLVYTGALANEGRTLTLRRADGTTEDTVVGGDTWLSVGGDNVTKETAQRTMTSWVTGTSTPGRENVSHDVPSASETDHEQTFVSKSTETRDDLAGVKITLTPQNEGLTLTVAAPSEAYVNQRLSFDVHASGLGKTVLNSLLYDWNFGDSHGGNGKTATHAFAYPGTYVVVASAHYGKYEAVARHTITVRPVTVTVSKESDGAYAIHNDAPFTIDISGYSLIGTKTVTFPPNSLILGNETIRIAESRVGNTGTVSLADPSGLVVATELPLMTSKHVGVETKATKKTLTASQTGSVSRQEMIDESATATAPIAADVVIPIGEPLAAAAGLGSPFRIPPLLSYVGLAGIILLGMVLLLSQRGKDTGINVSENES